MSQGNSISYNKETSHRGATNSAMALTDATKRSHMATDEFSSEKPLVAIPTFYNKLHFRSRLEARWAVFFDEMGIKYKYEPKGFELPDGSMYLPDFYLPVVNIFAEVKPTFLTEEEQQRCIGVHQKHGSRILMLTGTPDFKSYYCLEDFGDGKISEIDYSLDVKGSGYSAEYYFDENRLFCQPDYIPVEDTARDAKGLAQFSEEYQRAVSRAKFYRFGDSR